MTATGTIDTPLGTLIASFSDTDELTALEWSTAHGTRSISDGSLDGPLDGPLHRRAFATLSQQLDAYFAGSPEPFTIPLRPTGTPFQQLVWKAVGTIGHGQTSTYSAVAATIGRPSASRAVGQANAKNPIAVVIPCHRLVGSGGGLRGYAGGLERKRSLLDLERPR